jgi:3-methylcrotonyl-CoA carboxylase alpha subunit
MGVRLTRGDREYEAAVEPEGTGYRVTISGRTHVVDGLLGRVLRVRVDARPVEALARLEGDTIVIELAGRAYAFRRHSGRASRLAKRSPGARARRGEIHAPMPGLVVDVLASVGEEVQAGHPVVVVEAMKMQNALAAPVSGRVAAVSVSAGTAVESGQLLLVIEPGAV